MGRECEIIEGKYKTDSGMDQFSREIIFEGKITTYRPGLHGNA
jgi:hypothetical protein